MSYKKKINRNKVIGGIVDYTITVAALFMTNPTTAPVAAGATVAAATLDFGVKEWEASHEKSPAIQDDDVEICIKCSSEAWDEALREYDFSDVPWMHKWKLRRDVDGATHNTIFNWGVEECLNKFDVSDKPDKVIRDEIHAALTKWNNDTQVFGTREHELEKLNAYSNALTISYFKKFCLKISANHKLCSRLTGGEILKRIVDMASQNTKEHQEQKEFLGQIIGQLKSMQDDLQEKEGYDRETKQMLERMTKMLSELLDRMTKLEKQTKTGGDSTDGMSGSDSIDYSAVSVASLSFYKVRQLADNLWVNWETGVLAADRQSAMSSEADVSEEVHRSKDHRMAMDGEAAPAGEAAPTGEMASTGEAVSTGEAGFAGEAVLSGAASSVKKASSDEAAFLGTASTKAVSSGEAVVSSEVVVSSDEEASARREGLEPAQGKVFARLTARQLRLLSVLVQGEGALVSWKKLFWRGGMLEDWQAKNRDNLQARNRNDQKVKNQDNVQATNRDSWQARNWSDTDGLGTDPSEENLREKDGLWKIRYPKPDEASETAKEEIDRLCRKAPRLSAVISLSEDGRGCRLKLPKDELTGDNYETGDLFDAYEGCSESKDWSRLKDKEQSRIVSMPDGSYVYFCEDRNAWLRRYYSSLCSSFKDRISNARSKDENEGRVFGSYKMAQLYANAYAKVEKTVVDENGNAAEPDALLEFVADWYRECTGYKPAAEKTAVEQPDKEQTSSKNTVKEYGTGEQPGGEQPGKKQTSSKTTVKEYGTREQPGGKQIVKKQAALDDADRFGHVLVLHGQPGDGKTTFCKKAVYAHCKEGWLAEVPHVICLSLNPADSGIIGGGKLNLRLAFCLTKEEGDMKEEGDIDKYFLAQEKEKAGERNKDGLNGALIILDGYDELSGELAKKTDIKSFNGFCEKVEKTARKNHWNVVVTSRTMCIESELKTVDFRRAASRRVASFAPLTAEQQDAMISRMIELDSEQAEDLFAYRRDYLRPLWESYAAGFGTKGSNDAGQDADGRKGNSAGQDADGKKGNRAQDRRLRDFMAMLQVPSLFRMIVARRFTDFGEARNVAELYSRLFHSLLNYRGILNEEKEEALVEKYEDFAIRIFNYDNDTCPFSGKEAEDKELLYLFYTKRGKDEGGSGRLGFLHRLFYQYFLARYIVAAVRKGDSEKLFLNFRVAKNADPDLWNLIVQLAELEQDKHNYPEEYPEHRDSEGHNLLYHSYAGRIQAKHIKSVLDFLNDDDAVRKAAKVEEKDLLTRGDTRLGIGGQADDDAGDWAQVGRDENADERCGAIREARETENAILNLVSICAAMEKGCRIAWNAHGAGEDGKPSATGVGQDSKTSVTGAGKKSRSQADPIAYADYSYLCERLHRGEYSGIYLEEANLDGCLLENARFRRAHMAGIHLVGAKLDGADLAGADMKKAFLQGASLKRANLSRAILEEAHMEKAVFHKMLPDAAYNAIRMDGLVPDASAVRMDGARLEEADLSKARLEWANLVGANLDRADLREAHLEAAILIGTSLVGADLRKARFNDEDSVRKADGERLEKARLEKACLEKTQEQGEAQKTDDVSENSGIYDSEQSVYDSEASIYASEPTRRAELYAANLTRANLEEAYLPHVDLDRAVLKEALLASADLRQAQMGASYLKCASLEKTDLRGTMLKGACLEEAYVKAARLNKSTLLKMEGASLRGAVFDSEQVELARNIGLTDLDIRSRGSYEQNSRIERKEKESLIRIGRKREENLTEKNDDGKMDDARMRILNGETRGTPFGRYRQDKMIGELYVPTPLLWRVLKVDEENHRALLITEKLIDCVRYHEGYETITWEYCTLRKWMNGEFLREAFTAEEASWILPVWNENEDNPEGWDDRPVEGGNATRDLIFALSTAEVKEYFENKMDRRAAPNPYAMKKGSYVDDTCKTTNGETTGWWWLRSPGVFSNYAAYVNPDGDVYEFGSGVNYSSVSVRPALWLHL